MSRVKRGGEETSMEEHVFTFEKSAATNHSDDFDEEVPDCRLSAIKFTQEDTGGEAT